MKKLIFLALVFPIVAMSQNVPATVVINWTPPTTTVLGDPLTGSAAITKYQVYVSTATIPESATTPTVEVPGPSSASVTLTAPVGSTLYARVRACNAGGCSLLSNEGTKVVTIPKPGVPTSVTITINITG